MACKLCEARRPRRFCPGVAGDICSVCCGTGRENTINCPLECEYLQEARLRDKPPPITPEQIPNRDIRVSDEFLQANHRLIGILMRVIFEAGMETPGAVDQDVREALDALVRTYRTLEIGLYYETRPANLIAASIDQRVQQRLAEFRKLIQEHGLPPVRDADVLGSLVFLQRLELQLSNGRQRGRAFLHFLQDQTAPASGREELSRSSLVLP